MAWGGANKGGGVWEAVLNKARRGFSEQRPGHPEQVKGVVVP